MPDRSVIALAVLAAILAAAPRLGAAEATVELRYPGSRATFVLTGVEGGEVVFRNPGRDTGGRAYLAIDELLRRRATLLFAFGESFYEATGRLGREDAAGLLPAIEREVAPLAEFIPLAVVPGNLQPAVLTYLDALARAGEYGRAVELAGRMPLAEMSPSALEGVGELTFALDAAGRADLLGQLHARLLAFRGWSPEHARVLMEVADRWREGGEFSRAADLYQRVREADGPFGLRAALWTAYCGLHTDEAPDPAGLLAALPEMAVDSPGFSLRELVEARLALRADDLRGAMRFAARGKTYAYAGEAWYPELLFLTADLYDRLGQPEAAAMAHRELSVLFAGNPWAGKSRSRLDNSEGSPTEQ
jgi:hypothetical protein